jgi:hypothetical protein
MGRPRLGKNALSGAERQRRYMARLRAAASAPPPPSRPITSPPTPSLRTSSSARTASSDKLQSSLNRESRPHIKVDYPKFRIAFWHLLIGLFRETHKTRFPSQTRLGTCAQEILVYGAAISFYLQGQRIRSSKIAAFIDLPHETTRRHLARLLEWGVLVRENGHYRPSDHVSKTPTRNISRATRKLIEETAQSITAD